MKAPAEPPGTVGVPRRYFWSLVRWFWPFLRPYRGWLALSLCAVAVVLGAEAAIPLLTSDILTPPVGGARSLATLAVLIGAVLIAGNTADRAASKLVSRGAADLRLQVFNGLLTTQNLHQPRLFRSSVVSRHTTDVDHIADAAEGTIIRGLPSVVQIVVSLMLLVYVDIGAGMAMMLVTAGFLVARGRLGRRMLHRDRARLDASSAVGEIVDEAITMAEPIAGLQLQGWSRQRFAVRVDRLRLATYAQSRTVSYLATGANTAGLLGLFGVMVFASVLGQAQISLVAAALLYITTIVAALARLPQWVRELQLAVVSQRRIDQILVGAGVPEAARSALDNRAWRTLAGTNTLPAGLIGLVVSADLDADAVLTALTGADSQQAWRVSLFGRVMRAAGQRPQVLFVPNDETLFNTSVRDHVRAMAPDMSDEAVDTLLHRVALTNLAALPFGLDEPIGPAGAALTRHERARLLVAMAAAARPEVLLLGPMPLLADMDTAAPLLAVISEGGCRTIVVTVTTADVAASVDRILFVSDGGIESGTHPELLATCETYSRLWSTRLLGGSVDFASLGLDQDAQADLQGRLVTEHFHAGEILYRQADPADRVLFIISGRVQIVIDDGPARRTVAVLGPGNHCGDLSLTEHEARAETAVALEECVVRSLGRAAYATGVLDLLHRSEAQRRVLTAVLRAGHAHAEDLPALLPTWPPAEVTDAVQVLQREGALVQTSQGLRVVHRRRGRRGLDHVHDKLSEL